MDKFDNIYRIESNRLYGFDYSGEGIYFITLVVSSRECILGEVQNGKMILSKFGRIIDEEWLKSFKMRSVLFLDEYMIMPNHIHGLVIIKHETKTSDILLPEQNVKTHGSASLENKKIKDNIVWQVNPLTTEFKRKSKSLSSFVAGFKSASVSAIDNYIDSNLLDIPKYNRDNKLWLANYYDRIVRTEKEYWKIKQYIRSNPQHWDSDDLYI